MSTSLPPSTNSPDLENPNEPEYEKYTSKDERPTGWYLYCKDQNVYWGPSLNKEAVEISLEFVKDKCDSRHTANYHFNLKRTK